MDSIDVISVHVVSIIVGFSGWYSGILCPSNAKRSVASAFPWLFISLFAATVIEKMAGL